MPKTKPPPNRTGIPQSFYLDAALADALNAYIASNVTPPKKTTVYEIALQRFLQSQGFWPWPKP